MPRKRAFAAGTGCPEARASMRPRLMCRGNLRTINGVPTRTIASMRPRLMCRGNRRFATPCRCRHSRRNFERWQAPPAKPPPHAAVAHIQLPKNAAFSATCPESSGCRDWRRTKPLEAARRAPGLAHRKSRLNHDSPALDSRKAFADARHRQLRPVRGPHIDQQHVVLPRLHQLPQPRL